MGSASASPAESAARWTARSPRRRSSSRGTGSGRCALSTRPSSGRAAAPTRCRARNRSSKSALSTSSTTSAPRSPPSSVPSTSGSGARSASRLPEHRAESPHVESLASKKAIEAVWRVESARLLGGLVRLVRDVGLAEDLAQEALVLALERWPETGIPDKPGAWLMTAAKNRGLDELRRRRLVERKHEALGQEAFEPGPAGPADVERALDEDVGDDLLRLVLITCHDVLSTEARVALTLRLL